MWGIMNRFNSILKDQKYNEYLHKTYEHEVDRRFCRHNLEHFLDVARIANLLVLEQNLKIHKEIIYTTAILHDIGRFKQYEDGTPHEKASWDLAEELLKKYDFSNDERDLIKEGILEHRNSASTGFGHVMYEADKRSRLCISCKACDDCNWSNEKKNLDIYY